MKRGFCFWIKKKRGLANSENQYNLNDIYIYKEFVENIDKLLSMKSKQKIFELYRKINSHKRANNLLQNFSLSKVNRNKLKNTLQIIHLFRTSN